MNHRYATRLNSFSSGSTSGELSVQQLIGRASRVRGLTHVDLNYPDHADGSGRDVAKYVADSGLSINGFAMRYYSEPRFKLGAFTNPDKSVREKAIELTKRGIDAARDAGCRMMTLWLGQDGFDYPFQVDYSRLWDDEIFGIAAVAEHDPECLISIEYKPNEPRSYSVLPDCATTILAIREVGADNLGLTLDFAHVLYANEQPAFAAALAAKSARIFGIHLNDGYSKRDDGLMVGSVHFVQTLEFLRQAQISSYEGVIYFDTFPESTGLSPEDECAENIALVNLMFDQLDDPYWLSKLEEYQQTHDAVSIASLLRQKIYAARSHNTSENAANIGRMYV